MNAQPDDNTFSRYLAPEFRIHGAVAASRKQLLQPTRQVRTKAVV
jgi:hypothetical protein